MDWSRNTRAYIDPGSGGYLISSVLAAIGSVFAFASALVIHFFCNILGKRIANLWRNHRILLSMHDKKGEIMYPILLALMVFGIAASVFAQSSGASLKATVVSIPGGEDGIGFDDLNYSKTLHKILVPAGHTGKLYLVNPVSLSMDSIGQFTSSPKFHKGHDAGISSVDEGDGFLFVPDHGAHQLLAVDIKTGSTVASIALTGDPDFVRFVKGSNEVWVTEPDEKVNNKIEVFAFTAGNKPMLLHRLDISIPQGPESLVIDQMNQKAYTNIGKQTDVIDLHRHMVVNGWPNSCEKAHGTAVDEQRGFLFVACGEGKVVVLDLNQNGKRIGSLVTGAGVDLIDYNRRYSHLYVPAGKSSTLSVLGVSPKGGLSLLGIGQAAMKSHCVVSDDQDNIWVCDPKHGQLLRYKDAFAAVK